MNAYDSLASLLLACYYDLVSLSSPDGSIMKKEMHMHITIPGIHYCIGLISDFIFPKTSAYQTQTPVVVSSTFSRLG
ncbi:hypothetical protein B0H13DRAFT_291501 [Mycena leptocephala]|nr:hypothetical protein B0H13DRAFT_291501 [Mycena leptocephala]